MKHKVLTAALLVFYFRAKKILIINLYRPMMFRLLLLKENGFILLSLGMLLAKISNTRLVIHLF
jgi:hypothetical protein